MNPGMIPLTVGLVIMALFPTVYALQQKFPKFNALTNEPSKETFTAFFRYDTLTDMLTKPIPQGLTLQEWVPYWKIDKYVNKHQRRITDPEWDLLIQTFNKTRMTRERLVDFAALPRLSRYGYMKLAVSPNEDIRNAIMQNMNVPEDIRVLCALGMQGSTSLQFLSASTRQTGFQPITVPASETTAFVSTRFGVAL